MLDHQRRQRPGNRRGHGGPLAAHVGADLCIGPVGPLRDIGARDEDGRAAPGALGAGATTVGALIAPIALIGRTLVYLDLRVKKEGYTLCVLASETIC